MVKQADMNYQYMRDSGLVPSRVPGTDNIADLLTKILGRLQLLWLLKDVFGLSAEKDANGNIRLLRVAVLAPKVVQHGLVCVLAGDLDYGDVPRMLELIIDMDNECVSRCR